MSHWFLEFEGLLQADNEGNIAKLLFPLESLPPPFLTQPVDSLLKEHLRGREGGQRI